MQTDHTLIEHTTQNRGPMPKIVFKKSDREGGNAIWQDALQDR